MNYVGAGGSQWLMGIPFIFGPIVIYGAFALMGLHTIGVIAVGLVGLIGLVLYKQVIDFTYRRFFERRYTIASSFRKDDA